MILAGKKRGIAIPTIAVAILIMLVVVIMFATSPKIRTYVGEALGYNFTEALPGDEGWQPYQVTLKGSEIDVLRSMDALACALNSAARKKADFDNPEVCPEQVPEEGKKVNEDGTVSYGDVVVECEGITTTNLVLPSDEAAATKLLAELATECYVYGEKETRPYPIICADINSKNLPDGVEITEGEIEEELDNLKKGAELSGGSWYEFNQEEVSFDDITKDSKFVMYYEVIQASVHVDEKNELDHWVLLPLYLLKGARNIAGSISARLANTGKAFGSLFENKIFIGEKPEGRTLTYGEEMYQCSLKGFELPQQLSLTEEYGKWINGYGDPQYLAYYEAFPQSEETYWQGWSLANFGMNIFVASVMSLAFAIPGAKPGAKALQEALEVAVKDSLVKAGAEATEAAVEDVVAVVVRKEVMKDLVRQTFKETGEEAGVTRLLKEFDEVLKEGLERGLSPAEAVEKANQRIIERARITFPKEFTSDGTVHVVADAIERAIKEVGEESLETLTRRAFVKTYLKSLMDQTQRNFDEALIKKILGEVNEKLIPQLSKLSSKQRTKIIELVEKDIEVLITKKGGFAAFIEMNEAAVDSQIGKILSEGTEKQINSFFNKRFAIPTTEGITNRFGTVAKAEMDLFKRFIPRSGWIGPISPIAIKAFKFGRISADKAIKEASAAIDTKVSKEVTEQIAAIIAKNGPGEQASKEVAELLTKEGVESAAQKDVLKIVAKDSKHWLPYPKPQMSKWLWGKRNTILVGALLYGSYQEMMNEKRIPKGVNTLALTSPAFAIESLQYQQDLHPSAMKYYIATFNQHKADQKETRFNAASPCKTNLVIRNTICDCTRNYNKLQFNFGGGPTNIMKGTLPIRGNPPDAIRAKIEAYTKTDLTLVAKPTTYLGNGKTISDYVDYSHAVKECSELALMTPLGEDASQLEKYGETIWSAWSEAVDISGGHEEANVFGTALAKYRNYKPKCLTVSFEPNNYDSELDGNNYCIPRFPTSEGFKKGISTVILGLDFIVSLATPWTWGTNIVVIVGLNAFEATVNTWITEVWQKWPYHETGEW